MSWYYKDGDREVGPISKAQLQDLIKARRIGAQTLVRSSAMNEWRTLEDMARPKKPEQAGQAPPSAAQAPPLPDKPADRPSQRQAEGQAAASATAICSQCGRAFPRDQVVTFDNRVICAACKPMFVQKLKEGVDLPGIMNYAGFWIRFGAKIIDGLILAFLQWTIFISLGMTAFSSTPRDPSQWASSGALMLVGAQQLVGIALPALYTTFFIGRFSATPGKMACRLKVVDPEGGKVSYLRALGRNFGEWISTIILCIGYLLAAFDGEKRALHDRICSTRVVHS